MVQVLNESAELGKISEALTEAFKGSQDNTGLAFTGHFKGDITSERMYRIGSFYIIKFSLVTFEKAENSSQRSLAPF